MEECNCDGICEYNIVKKDLSHFFDLVPKSTGLIPKLFTSLGNQLSPKNIDAVFEEYLIHIEFDLKSLLSTTLKTNKRTVLNINNSPDSALLNLVLTDIIPQELIQFGVLSLEVLNNKLRFYIGSSASTKTVTTYDYDFPSLNSASKITCQIHVDSRTKHARIIAYIDDLRIFFDITSTYTIEPLGVSSFYFIHPAVSNFKINTANPRFDIDTIKNQLSATFTSKFCSASVGVPNCSKCSYVSNKTFSCDSCDSGFLLMNNVCTKSLSNK